MSTGNRTRVKNRGTSTSGAQRRAAKLELVTALLCTATEFPGELSAHYPGACERLDLPAREAGYALRLAQDADGARWTIVSRDVAFVSAALSIRAMGIEASLSVDLGDVEHVLPGWPVACSLGLADRSAPHDPPGSVRGLRPTHPLSWAPTMRRVMADAIARELLEPVDAGSRELAWLDLGLSLSDQPARVLDLATRPPMPEHEPAVSAALDQARALAHDGAPVGAVRVVRSGDQPILVRATSDTWSLAARTRSGGAMLLLDEIPGCGLEISGAEGLGRVLAELAESRETHRGRSPGGQ